MNLTLHNSSYNEPILSGSCKTEVGTLMQQQDLLIAQDKAKLINNQNITHRLNYECDHIEIIKDPLITVNQLSRYSKELKSKNNDPIAFKESSKMKIGSSCFK
ncbi:hypothetical protein IPH25_03665 [bacterium]|nr:MAG: hypothetical protein IPG37_00660 [bacterium]QQR61552.1 MAG: hypothetical protein IPH25_03665 [bacterium]QQR62916.1 MAG: hypothetical protein IPH67_00300 [bacterium]